MSERRDPPQPGAVPRDGDARPATGRRRSLDSLDSTRPAPAEANAGGGKSEARSEARSGAGAGAKSGAAPARGRRDSGERSRREGSSGERSPRAGDGRERGERGERGERERGPRAASDRDSGPRKPGGPRGAGPRKPGAGGAGGRAFADGRRGPGPRTGAAGARPGAKAEPGRSNGPRGDKKDPRPADPYARFRREHPAVPELPADDGHPGARVRAIAARTLDAVLHRGRSLKAELAAALPALADPRDRALVEAICFAVLRQPLKFEAALGQWMPRALTPRDGELRALLMAGLAQLDPMGLPAHAALDASVQAARLLGRAHQAGLVNALLRRAQRDGLPATDPRHSHWPSWLRGMLRKDWPQDYDAILAHSALAPPMWLRVNRARGSREDYRQRLIEAGLIDAGLDAAGLDAAAPADEAAGPDRSDQTDNADRADHTDPADALRLDVPQAVAALPGFAEGAVSVQDVSAQRVADALAPAPGARVLDACAAPGGKSAHLLERDAGLRLTALDVDAARLQRVRVTLARSGFDADGERVRLHAADAADLDAWWDGAPFDAVLLDAPCSATGIVRRQPDVVLHRRESDIAALSLLQARLLDALWRTLAPGGVLVYATCSILKAENEDQVRAFLARTADARIEALGAEFGRDREVGRQRLPGEDGGDGFFYARLRRAG